MNAAISKQNRPPRPGLTSAQQDDLTRAKRTGRWVGLIAPLVVVTAALVLVLVWMPRMPIPAATHWGGSGGPDGFGSPWSYVWMLLLAGHGIVLMMWAFVAYASRMPAPSPKRALPVWAGFQRGLAAFSLGYAVFMAIVTLASVAVQLDVSDAKQAGGVGLAMAIGFAVWVLVTVLGWFLQPKVEVRAAEQPIDPLPLTESERAVWFGEVRPSKAFLAIIGVTIVIMLGAVALIVFVPADPGEETVKNVAAIAVGVLLLVVVALCIMTAWFRVRIDAQGLEARSALGWPVFRLPSDDVQRVDTAQINPLGEFGGWGLRWAPGRFGIVMRSGEGLVATRQDGRIFAVTVDGAEEAAAVLAAVAKGAER